MPKSEKTTVTIPKLEEIKTHPSWPLKVAYCFQKKWNGLGTATEISDSVCKTFSAKKENTKEEKPRLWDKWNWLYQLTDTLY